MENFECILGGDTNAHSALWENDSKEDDRGTKLESAITDSKFIILNNGDHTYQNINTLKTSAIDIT